MWLVIYLHPVRQLVPVDIGISIHVLFLFRSQEIML